MQNYVNKILLGDCLEIMKDIPDNSIDLIVTDPPYGDNYKSNSQTINRRTGNHLKVRKNNYFKEILGDSELPIDWLQSAYRVLKESSAIYIFCKWRFWGKLSMEVENVGFKVKNMLVMSKSNHGMGDLKGSYAPKHELLLFATKGRHLLNFPGGREKDVWDVKVKYSGSFHYHPNEKPFSWILPAIINSSKVNDVILDPFIGGGTTAIVCLKTSRYFVGIEKDEKYWEIANQRVEEWNKSRR